MADELRLSPKTVSTYKARIIAKMDFQRDADIIRYALEHQLVN
ncbi:MAG: LuxR C-terminal-related transcriptional regulator [Nitrospirota bacterium]